MENERAHITPIIYFLHSPSKLPSYSPTISWTSKFVESLGVEELEYIRYNPPFNPYDPSDRLDPSEQVWKISTKEESTTVVTFEEFSSYFPIQVLHRDELPIFKSQNDRSDSNLRKLFLDPIGSSFCFKSKRRGGRGRFRRTGRPQSPCLWYEIHCCVKPTVRCCVNEMPVEIMENIFWFIDDPTSSKTSGSSRDDSAIRNLTLVCRFWKEISIRYEKEPSDAHVKLIKVQTKPVQRFRWTKLHHDRDTLVDFHQYIQTVLPFQPCLTHVDIQPPSNESTLDDLETLAKLPTIKYIILRGWNSVQVFGFIRARRHLELYELKIYDTTHDETQESERSNEVDVSSSNRKDQLLRVKYLEINPIDDSIHTILASLQKNYVEQLSLFYGNENLQPLERSIELIGFKNLIQLEIDGGNDESGLLSYDFISRTCTTSNFPKLLALGIFYCFLNPRDVTSILEMTKLLSVSITLFMSQKTDENETITSQIMKQFNSGPGGRCYIRYSDGDDRWMDRM